jgi:hypothetical protein
MTEANYRLVERQGPTPGQVFELTKDEVAIGRDITNDIVINEAEVSRKHARLTLEGDRYKIEDLDSTNGTYINGQRLIGPHVLAVGEVIMFGDNVGMVFDGEPIQPEVTAERPVDLGSTPVAAMPAPEESPVPSAVATPQEKVTLTPEQARADIQPEQPVAEGRKPINSWLLAGFGCLLVIIILLVALLVFIDQPWNPGGGLYCVSPFDIIFKALGYCP